MVSEAMSSVCLYGYGWKLPQHNQFSRLHVQSLFSNVSTFSSLIIRLFFAILRRQEAFCFRWHLGTIKSILNLTSNG